MGGGGWSGRGGGGVPRGRFRPIRVAWTRQRLCRCQLSFRSETERLREFSEQRSRKEKKRKKSFQAADLQTAPVSSSSNSGSGRSSAFSHNLCTGEFLRVSGCTILGSVLRLYGPDPTAGTALSSVFCGLMTLSFNLYMFNSPWL